MTYSTNAQHQLQNDNTNIVEHIPDPPLPENLRRLDEQEGYQPLGSVDIVWNDLEASSDFSILRFKSYDPIEQLLVRLGTSIESGVFEHVYSVSASRFALFITIATKKDVDELGRKVFLHDG